MEYYTYNNDTNQHYFIEDGGVSEVRLQHISEDDFRYTDGVSSIYINKSKGVITSKGTDENDYVLYGVIKVAMDAIDALNRYLQE